METKILIDSAQKISSQEIQQVLQELFPDREVWLVTQIGFRDAKECVKYFFNRFVWTIIYMFIAFTIGYTSIDGLNLPWIKKWTCKGKCEITIFQLNKRTGQAVALGVTTVPTGKSNLVIEQAK